MSKKATSIISYLSVIGWLIAFLAGDREGAKFYLNQSLLIVLSNLILTIAAKILGGGILGAIISILDFVVFVFWVMGFVHAIRQDDTPVPVIGDIEILK